MKFFDFKTEKKKMHDIGRSLQGVAMNTLLT